MLLDKGADPNAPPVPSSRDTALTIAADKGHYRFCELVLSRWGRGFVFEQSSASATSAFRLAAATARKNTHSFLASCCILVRMCFPAPGVTGVLCGTLCFLCTGEMLAREARWSPGRRVPVAIDRENDRDQAANASSDHFHRQWTVAQALVHARSALPRRTGWSFVLMLQGCTGGGQKQEGQYASVAGLQRRPLGRSEAAGRQRRWRQRGRQPQRHPADGRFPQRSRAGTVAWQTLARLVWWSDKRIA